MMTLGNRSICLLLALLIAFSMLSVGTAAVDQTLDSALKCSADYILKTVTEPEIGSIGGEWAVIGLARSEAEVPKEYWNRYYLAVEKEVQAKNGVLHEKKLTEYSRVILALTAIGADPADVAGFNLLLPLGDFDKTVWQGINGPVWALIALDAKAYPMPKNKQAKTQATRQMYVDYILDCQLDNGGWNLTAKGGKGAADPDITAMTLQALSNYQSDQTVKRAIDRALDCLSDMQNDRGGFVSYGNENMESCVQVIVALTALGIDLDDERFVKNGSSLFEHLMSFSNKDGSFVHTLKGTAGNDLMSSEQGLYCLAAVKRAVDGRSSLYTMDDVRIHVSGETQNKNGLSGKHKDVQIPSVTASGKTFPDIQGHENQEAIETLASHGIISGTDTGLFAPDKTMTRAEFATIVVRALGLPQKRTDVFEDVSAKDWFAPYVGSAYAYGIVNGTGEGVFSPNGTITRQEAAVMTARAANLCGMDTARNKQAIRNILAPFADYVTVAPWAQESVAFCYQETILDPNDMEIEPTRAILRCEIAQMLYMLLQQANLM